MLGGVIWWDRDGEGFSRGASCSNGVESLLPRMFVVVGGDVGWERVDEGFSRGTGCSMGVESLLPRKFVVEGGDFGWRRGRLWRVAELLCCTRCIL